MAEIVKNINDLIYRAYKLINIAQPDQDISNSKLADGLYLLNSLLDSYTDSGLYIPFRKKITFYLQSNVPDYYFGFSNSVTVTSSDQIILLDSVLLTDDNTVYQIDIIDLDQENYTKLYNINNTRPYLVRMQRNIEYTTLTFIKTPDKSYQIEIWAKIPFAHLTGREVVDNVPAYYHRFLRYALARELSCEYSSSSWNEKHESEYIEMKNKIETASNKDYRIKTENPFNYNNYDFYIGDYY